MSAAASRTNPCCNCGHDVGIENPPRKPGGHCGNCPPWRCEDCGEMCHSTDLCSCWVSFDGMNLADIKAHMTEAGFTVGGLADAEDGGR